MPISVNLSSTNATATAKISDAKAIIDAVNAELDKLATKATLDTLTVRVAGLEDSPIPSDLGTIIAGLEDRIDALEARPAPATSPATAAGTYERPARPAGLRADEVSLVYDRATLYYRDMELYADRIGEQKWRLYSQLNYIVISPAVWTYDEIVEGTPDEVYAYAVQRLEELAELKPQHDAVHDRVKAMSEGQP